MKSQAHDRFAGMCAVLAGIFVFVYSIGFVVLKNPLLYSLMQALGGLLALIALAALYRRVKGTDEGMALIAFVLAIIGCVGSTLHGGYDLANALNPPDANLAALANLPSQIDPRGMLTFGVAGLALFFFAALMLRSNQMPKPLGTLGYVLGVLMVLTYLGRLIILSAASPLVLIPAALTGFIANPIFYIWLGMVLM